MRARTIDGINEQLKSIKSVSACWFAPDHQLAGTCRRPPQSGDPPCMELNPPPSLPSPTCQITQAVQLHKDNQLDAAEIKYLEALKYSSKHADAARQLGVLLWERDGAASVSAT